MAVSKAQQDCVTRYKKAHYDQIMVTVPKGRRADVQAAAAARGLSVNTYIGQLIKSDLHLTDDQWKSAADGPSSAEGR